VSGLVLVLALQRESRPGRERCSSGWVGGVSLVFLEGEGDVVCYLLDAVGVLVCVFVELED
jgi:hypothetical protein